MLMFFHKLGQLLAPKWATISIKIRTLLKVTIMSKYGSIERLPENVDSCGELLALKIVNSTITLNLRT